MNKNRQKQRDDYLKMTTKKTPNWYTPKAITNRNKMATVM